MISRLKARLSSLDVESEENEGGRQRHDARAAASLTAAEKDAPAAARHSIKDRSRPPPAR